jgi:hypothetical protein
MCRNGVEEEGGYVSICVDTCRYVRALEKSSYSIGMLGYKTYISKNNGEGTRSAHDAKASTFFTSIGLIRGLDRELPKRAEIMRGLDRELL